MERKTVVDVRNTFVNFLDFLQYLSKSPFNKEEQNESY